LTRSTVPPVYPPRLNERPGSRCAVVHAIQKVNGEKSRSVRPPRLPEVVGRAEPPESTPVNRNRNKGRSDTVALVGQPGRGCTVISVSSAQDLSGGTTRSEGYTAIEKCRDGWDMTSRFNLST
jgi:hypothetical protein